MKKSIYIITTILIATSLFISCKDKKETVKIIEKEKTVPRKEKANYFKIDKKGNVEVKIEAK
ncbi:hypothetical protein [Wenyingzhuangia aestuarii]|uniref:hypothetical protein n=1 Tax=Wenyingzhuangia aestuarii TaxID=1647582 RepID=UPI001439F720|nr:hypothetical protein [Wenyingzhuangia aestuarii]NJB82720.1 hypothetical protein [Wenyingzhuangia aestuarii]